MGTINSPVGVLHTEKKKHLGTAEKFSVCKETNHNNKLNDQCTRILYFKPYHNLIFKTTPYSPNALVLL